ncbi:MAG: hypothetical protein ACRDZ4_07000 [Egibacteraceae bacterium]
MNALSLQALYPTTYRAPMFDYEERPHTDASLAYRLQALSPEARQEVLARAIDWGVQRGVQDWAARNDAGMGDLSQDALTGAITIAVQNALAPLMPTLGQELMRVAEPAARKAADVVGPVIEEKLRAWGPTLAAITGVVAAVLSLVGMFLLGQYVVGKVR